MYCFTDLFASLDFERKKQQAFKIGQALVWYTHPPYHTYHPKHESNTNHLQFILYLPTVVHRTCVGNRVLPMYSYVPASRLINLEVHTMMRHLVTTDTDQQWPE